MRSACKYVLALAHFEIVFNKNTYRNYFVWAITKCMQKSCLANYRPPRAPPPPLCPPRPQSSPLASPASLLPLPLRPSWCGLRMPPPIPPHSLSALNGVRPKNALPISPCGRHASGRMGLPVVVAGLSRLTRCLPRPGENCCQYYGPFRVANKKSLGNLKQYVCCSRSRKSSMRTNHGPSGARVVAVGCGVAQRSVSFPA